jgi:prevent-host-death family protein
MTTIGIRELKNQATEILREVRERQAEYIVTYRGKPVAILAPVAGDWQLRKPSQTATVVRDREAIWAEWDKLAQEIDENWESEFGAVELLSRDRDA